MGLDITGNGISYQFTKTPAPTTALTPANGGLEAGGMLPGNYYYKVSFVTAEGETELGIASAVVAVSGHVSQNKALLSDIPLGGAGVIARRIYRTHVNTAVGDLYYTLNAYMEISDNTTTDLVDDNADTFMLRFGLEDNYTGGKIYTDGLLSCFFGETNTLIGLDVGSSLDTGTFNTFVGVEAGRATTKTLSGDYQGATYIGYAAGRSNTTGITNTAVGTNALIASTVGSQNTAVGVSSGNKNVSGKHNAFIGVHAGFEQVTAHYSVFLGGYAGDASSVGGEAAAAEFDSVICIGYSNKVTAANQCVIGSSVTNGKIFNFYLGQGVETPAPEGVTVHASSATTDDTSGGDHTIASGKGVGNGAVSSVNLDTPDAEASGSTKQSLVNRVKVDENGLQLSRNDTAVVAPGADKALLRVEAGTTAGTLKIVAYAGTSTVGVTIADNIGTGST